MFLLYITSIYFQFRRDKKYHDRVTLRGEKNSRSTTEQLSFLFLFFLLSPFLSHLPKCQSLPKAIIMVQSAERRRRARVFFALLKVQTKAATFLQRTYRAHLARTAEKARYVRACTVFINTNTLVF